VVAGDRTTRWRSQPPGTNFRSCCTIGADCEGGSDGGGCGVD
jgi:hypothetical protein